MSGFANEVDNYPMVFSLLNLVRFERNQFRPAQPAAQQKSKHCSIPLSTKRPWLKSTEKLPTLLSREPIAHGLSQTFYSFDTPDSSDEFRAQQPGVRCLITCVVAVHACVTARGES